MENTKKTKDELVEESIEMRQRIAKLEAAEAEYERAQNALEASQERYKNLVDSIDGIVWEANARTFQFTFVSQQAERLLGYPVERWTDEPTFWQDHLHPEDESWAPGFCVRATAEKRDHEFEYRMIAADGRTVWLRDIVNVIIEDREPVKLRGVMVDITLRKKMDEELATHRNHLEKLVEARTAELEAVNERLKQGLSERRRAEQALQEERDFISAVLNTVDALVVVLDKDGRVIRFNRACEQITGYLFDEVKDEHFWDVFLLSEEEEAVRDVFQELLVGQFPNQFTNYWVAKDGARRLIAWSNTVLLDETGSIEYVISTGIDVTERKEAEEALRRDRDFVALVMQTSPAGITVVNREGEIVLANAQAERVLSLTEDDLNGLAYNAPTWQITDYEGNPMPDEALPFRRVLDAEQVVYDVEHAIERPNGERVLLSVNGAPLFDASGRISRVVFAIEDVTERVQAERALRDSEERFRDLYENAPSAYLSVDAAGMIDRCNEKTHVLLGYPVEELVGRSIIELCADVPQGKEKAKQVWARFQDGEPITDAELQIKRADGTVLWISLTMNAVRDATGKLLEGRATVVDISERKQAEEARERELYSLEKLSGTARAGITAESFGLNPLRRALPTVFEGLVQRYEHLLGLALERRAYKVEYNLAEDLCVLAERLGALKAGPRDVVDVHVTALKRKSQGASIPKAQAYLDEGRLMVLELMGYLASYYRNYLIGVGQVSATDVSEVEGGARG